MLKTSRLLVLTKRIAVSGDENGFHSSQMWRACAVTCTTKTLASKRLKFFDFFFIFCKANIPVKSSFDCRIRQENLVIDALLSDPNSFPSLLLMQVI